MARFTSADTKLTSQPCSRGDRAARAGRVIAGALVAGFLGTTVPAMASVMPSRQAVENHACSVILGLNPSEADYAACAGSIDRTLSFVGANEAVAKDRMDCADQGLTSDTAAFARCVVAGGEVPVTDWSEPISAR